MLKRYPIRLAANPKNILKSSAFACLLFGLVTVGVGCRKTEFSATPNAANGENNSALRAATTKPNIILILGDDVGYEIPTVNGGQSYSTPNLDKMAQVGMRFTQVRSTPLCSPSRFELLTGKYNFRNYSLWGSMDTTNRTIANMLSDAGYKTLICGKWQLSGGDTAIRSLGFQDYMVWNPYTAEGDEHVDGKGSRYKDPIIFTAGHFLPDDSTKGRYGDDLFTNHILNFIDSNRNDPFFVYYPICLVHPPFCPTPLDPEFQTWNSSPKNSDPKFYPSMVKYMDLKIGQILDKVRDSRLANNTIVIFVGDNGTSQQITSMFQGQPFTGGKGTDQESGIHVPMMIWWQNQVSPGTVNNDLVDLSDFMPTLAGIANVPVPTTYGTLDGVSFYPRLHGLPGTPREWSYCYFYPNPIKRPDRRDSWVQNGTYKLYSDSSSRNHNKFYNFINDPAEVTPLKTSQLTTEEKQTRRTFRNVLKTLP